MRGKAQALLHETTIAKANAAATSCWLEVTVPEYDKKVTAGIKKEHVYRSEDATWWWRCKGFWCSRQGVKELRAIAAGG